MRFLIFTLLFTLLSCQQSKTDAKNHVYRSVRPGEKRFDIKSYEIMKFALSSGRLIETFVADTLDKQTQGLSGTMRDEIQDHQGMIFTYSAPSQRQFWMPNTHFNLDIFFLDKNFKVLHIDRGVKAHPSTVEPVPRSSVVYAQNILELAADSGVSQEIKIGMTLKVLP